MHVFRILDILPHAGAQEACIGADARCGRPDRTNAAEPGPKGRSAPVDIEANLIAAGVGTIPCVIFDLVIQAVQRWQRDRLGITEASTLGPFGKVMVSLLFNFLFCAAFMFAYSVIAAGSGNAFLVGGIIWLMIAIPLLLTSKYLDDLQKQMFATRILGWLFKTGSAAASASYFIG